MYFDGLHSSLFDNLGNMINYDIQISPLVGKYTIIDNLQYDIFLELDGINMYRGGYCEGQKYYIGGMCVGYECIT